jgi:TonB family protein
LSRSFSLRNTLIISGVVTIHLLAFLLFSPSSFDGERSFASQSIAVNLVHLNSRPSSQRKHMLIPNPSTIAPAGNPNSTLPEESSISGGEKGVSHSLGVIPRQMMYNPKPNYPLTSRKLREQGLVMIKLCVNQGGFVDQATVFKSSGFQGLDQSALRTLSQWKFHPLSSTLKHASQCFHAPVHFSLEGSA